jgi:excisionase family DNA binding protein
MNVARVAAVILKHLAPALEAARTELELAACEEARRVPGPLAIMNSVQAAERLEVSDRTIRGWCDAGLIPHKRLGRSILISERALLEWIEAGRAEKVG